MWGKKIRNGYLYAAVGEKYIEEARQSIKSLRSHNPEAHVTIVTNQNVKLDEVDDVKIIDFKNELGNWKPGTLFKILALLKSPYERTFFVDTDTYFCDQCDELFRLLDYFDLLIAHSPADDSMVNLDNRFIDGYFPYNTGVIVLKTHRSINKFLSKWNQIYAAKMHLYPHDQTPFMEALLSSSIKTYTLQSIYNFRMPFNVSIVGKRVKILHGRYNGDLEQLGEVLNATDTHRTWLPSKGIVESLIREESSKSIPVNSTKSTGNLQV